MDKTQVAAPISGYILTMNVEEGNNYAQGNTVFTIADTSGYIVEGTVNEYDIANIKADLPATVKFEATGDEEFEGTVSFVSIASEASTASSAASEAFGGASAAASTSTGTATYKVKIKLNEADDRFRVGMTAKASIILASAKDVLAVPYDCVQEKDDGSFFVTSIADDGTKKDIPVTKGLESDYYVEIKGDGIKEGMSLETIITDAPSTDIMDYMTFE
jgi:multidrug efflux pump subunit AcrA (membrane-fusion protein)